MIAQGLRLEQHEIGATIRTLSRTVSETDIVTFVNLCGFTEPPLHGHGIRRARVGVQAATGALTFALAEGLIIQTGLIHGTVMAYLGGELRVTGRCSRAIRSPSRSRSPTNARRKSLTAASSPNATAS